VTKKQSRAPAFVKGPIPVGIRMKKQNLGTKKSDTENMLREKSSSLSALRIGSTFYS
jgi:hypothetical protein